MLTEHQKKIYEDVVFHDYSLSEIAQEQGISRQGVHDLIKRCNKTLSDYESKLHLVERFMKTKKIAEEMNVLLQSYEQTKENHILEKIQTLSKELLAEV